MKTDLTILCKLEELIGNHLSDYLDKVEGLDFELPEIKPINVIQDFPDTDNMRCSTMFNIVAQYGENEELTIQSDLATLDVSVFITAKRDKSTNLQKKVFGYYSAFEIMLWNHQNLDGLTDFADVVSADYYPAVEGDINVAGIEISIQLKYAKEYL